LIVVVVDGDAGFLVVAFDVVVVVLDVVVSAERNMGMAGCGGGCRMAVDI
jgi:hypothetical protein